MITFICYYFVLYAYDVIPSVAMRDSIAALSGFELGVELVATVVVWLFIRDGK